MTINNYFLDANIFLRHLTQDNKRLSAKATQVFEKIAETEIVGVINTLVLHEVIYILHNIYEVKKNVIVKNLTALLRLEHLQVLDLDKESLERSLRLFEKNKIDFPDCVYVSIAQTNNYKLMSFDKDYQKIGAESYQDLS